MVPSPSWIVSLRIVLLIAALAFSHRVCAQNFWQPYGGPLGGNVQAIAYDATAPGYLYAGMVWRHTPGGTFSSGTVYRSTDLGQTWTRLNISLAVTDPTRRRVRAIAINASGHVFVGLERGGVIRSLDHGTTWASVNSGITDLTVRDVAINANGDLYASTNAGGVFRSINNGGTWVAANTNLTNLDTRSLIVQPNFLLVGTRTGGVFKSTSPNGVWASANTGMTNLGVNCMHRDPVSGIVYCGVDNGLYQSLNDGGTWSSVTGPFTGNIVQSITSARGALFVGMPEGVYKSTNGGTDWQLPGNWPLDPQTRALHSAAGILFAGTLRVGMYRSTDNGSTWTPGNSGINAYTVHSIAFGSANRCFISTIVNGMHHSDDNGTNWSVTAFPSEDVWIIRRSPWGDLFAGISGISSSGNLNHIQRSTDNGQTWTPLNSGLTANIVSGIQFGTTNEVYCSTGWNPAGVYRSTDNGNSWTHFGLGWASIGEPSAHATLCLTRRSNGDLWAGSEGSGVWRRLAGNSNWEYTGLNQATGAGQQFAITFLSNGYGFAAHDGGNYGIYRTTSGQPGTWLPYTPIPDRVFDIVATPNDVLYAGSMNGGVYRSTDFGNSWIPINTGLSADGVQCLAIGKDNHLYAGTSGWGVFRSVLPVYVRPGDVNADGTVNVTDLLMVINAWGRCPIPPATCPADMAPPPNGDGMVNVSDLLLVINNWG